MFFIRLFLMKIRRKKWPVFLGIAAFILCIIFLKSDLSPDLYFVHLGPWDNVSCHYEKISGDLLSIGEPGFEPSENSIFFHETSCRGGLNSRQACAVESAARAHPDWRIYVLFSGPVPKTSGKLDLLQEYKNINLRRVHLLEYAKDTPVEQLVFSGGLNRTRWRISHTSDLLRYLTLYKWGGVYLDLDVIVGRNLAELGGNWAVKESAGLVASAALAFSNDDLGRKVSEAAIRDLSENFRGDRWSQNGPDVITRVLKKLCSTFDVLKMSPATCDDFSLQKQDFFLISWTNAEMYAEIGFIDTEKTYAYHVWNKMTHKYTMNSESRYVQLARRFCPKVYQVYGDDIILGKDWSE